MYLQIDDGTGKCLFIEERAPLMHIIEARNRANSDDISANPYCDCNCLSSHLSERKETTTKAHVHSIQGAEPPFTNNFRRAPAPQPPYRKHKMGVTSPKLQCNCSITRATYLELFQDPHSLPCLHTFCLECIKRTVHGSNTFKCPLCCAVSCAEPRSVKRRQSSLP